MSDLSSIMSEKEALQKQFEVEKQLDEDIAHRCNDNPFDTTTHERTLKTKYRKIPWPCLTSMYRIHLAGQRLSLQWRMTRFTFPRKRYNQDQILYDWAKNAAAKKKAKDARIKEDQIIRCRQTSKQH